MIEVLNVALAVLYLVKKKGGSRGFSLVLLSCKLFAWRWAGFTAMQLSFCCQRINYICKDEKLFLLFNSCNIVEIEV